MREGVPVDGTVSITFSLYTAPSGGSALWSETHSVTVTDGVYNVVLGNTTPLIPGHFVDPLYLGIQAGADDEMTPRQKINAAPYALRAQVAESVEEGSVTTVMIEDSAVTSLKLADYSITETKLGDAAVTALKMQDGAALLEISDNDGTGSGLDADLLDGKDSGEFASADYVTTLESRIEDLEAQVAQLTALLQGVTRAGNDITFSGVNVHVVNGNGTTTGAVNGLGNLIVGYNELRGSGDDRTGSHNIVVGARHNYSSYGGLVAGSWNSIEGEFCSVSGGKYNTAANIYDSVSGGHNNTASGWGSSVSGGRYNTASKDFSSVSGGYNNTASGFAASVTGGRNNEATGDCSVVTGWTDIAGTNDYDVRPYPCLGGYCR